MADYYLRNTGGLDTNDGLSWATAKATIVGALSSPFAAGDTLYVADDHVESMTAARVMSFPGTPAQPNRVICAKANTMPPTEVATSASITTTTSNGNLFAGSVVMSGLKFSTGTGSTSNANLTILSGTAIDAIQVYQNCDLFLGTNGSTSIIAVGSSATTNAAKSRVLLSNTNLRLNASAQTLAIQQEITWRGGKLFAPAGTAPVAPSFLLRVGAQGRGVPVYVEGVDLTELGVASDLVSGPQSTGRVTFRNCSLPVGWSGMPVQGLIDPGLRVEMHNCDSVDTNYRLWVMAFLGSIRSDAAIYKIGGASDGVTPISLKVSTNANSTVGNVGLETPEIMIWNTTVGSQITVSIDIISDGVALTNNDAWLDVQYMGTSGLPKSTFVNTRPALLTAASTYTSNTATWNNSNTLTTPQKQRLSAQITPQEAGVIHVRFVLAKPNTTVYVDPKVQVT